MCAKVKPWPDAILPPNADFGKRLEWLMLTQGVSGRDLAVACGMKRESGSPISAWIHGKCKPCPKNLRIISEYFGVMPRWLLTGQGRMKSWQTGKR